MISDLPRLGGTGNLQYISRKIKVKIKIEVGFGTGDEEIESI